MDKSTQHERMISHLRRATSALEIHITETSKGVAHHLENVDTITTTPSPEEA